MNQKIDLHIHSTFSDGMDTVKEIIESAKDQKVGIISLSDHDSIAGVEKIAELGKRVGIKVIPGVEISTTYRGKLLHILGYFMDIKNTELLDFLKSVVEEKRSHFRSELIGVNEALEKAGRKNIDLEKYLAKKEDRYFSLPGIALYFQEEGIFDKFYTAFNFLAGKIKPPLFSKEPEEVFRIIKKAGGISVLAHSLAPKVSLRKITQDPLEWDRIIAEFKNQGLSGIECYGLAHSKEEIEVILEFSEKYGLLLTAGSDWHGSFEKQGGDNIKKYLPFYKGEFEGVEVPDKIYSYFKNK